MKQNKCIIITVYNSENCGSFLQAFAMMRTLERLGYEVAFLKRNWQGTSHDKIKRRQVVKKLLFHLQLKKAFYLWKQWCDFEKAQQIFKICEMHDAFYNQANLVILGSDTIWNFDDSYFCNHIKRYLGAEIKEKRIISYAASVGNTQEETFRQALKNYGKLSNLHRILVRDENTKDFVENTTNFTADLVCDPTLLVTSDTFIPLRFNVKDSGYLLLYYFNEPSETLQKELVAFAKERNIKIVSLLTYRSWCDIYVPSSPQAMVSYFEKAEYVVTNTFHGCAFSLIYGKHFAVHDEKKIKVTELLEKYGQLGHIFTDDQKATDKLINIKPISLHVLSEISSDSLNKLKEAIL